jgi:hypothetical protein
VIVQPRRCLEGAEPVARVREGHDAHHRSRGRP